MKFRLTALIAFLALLPLAGRAQTTVIARPVSDANGFAVFQIMQVVRVEGTWIRPLTVGQLIYPQTATKAYPLTRFGEAVVIALPEPGNVEHWQGVYVHNGFIPALNGIPINTLIKDLASRPIPTPSEPINVPVREESECPVCHKIHLHF